MTYLLAIVCALAVGAVLVAVALLALYLTCGGRLRDAPTAARAAGRTLREVRRPLSARSTIPIPTRRRR